MHATFRFHDKESPEQLSNYQMPMEVSGLNDLFHALV